MYIKFDISNAYLLIIGKYTLPRYLLGFPQGEHFLFTKNTRIDVNVMC